MGEVLAVTPLIRCYAEANPNKKVLITTTTPTGAEQAEKLSDIAEHRYMPLDFGFAVKRFLRTIQPQKMVIVETEIWPNTLTTVANSGIPITVINARLSERSYRSYAKVRPFFWLAAQHIDQLCCQFEEDAERFIRLGVRSERIAVTGSIKFDITVPDSVSALGIQLRESLGKTRPVWIAASTHAGEDEQVLEAHKNIIKALPNALLILVPRHPERFNSVEQLCLAQHFQIERRSQISGAVDTQTQVFLGDTMGDMMTYLAASDICFMGGSLIGKKVGGHNLLEPAALGVPSLTGPSYFNFTQVVNMLNEVDAVDIIESAQELGDQIIALMKDANRRTYMAQAAKLVVNQSQGALIKSLAFLS